MKRLLLLFALCLPLAAQQVPPQRNAYGPVSQGATIQIPNTAGSQAVSFEYVFSATPGSVSITIQGCMRGKDGTPGQVGTCDAATDTYSSTSHSIRSPSFTKVYDTFLITVTTLTSATLTVNTTVVVSKAGTSGGGGSGSGTVSANNGVTNVIATYAAAGGSTTVGPASSSSPSACLPGATSGESCFTAAAVAGTVTNPVVGTNVFQLPQGNTTNPTIGNSTQTSVGVNVNASNSVDLVTNGAVQFHSSNSFNTTTPPICDAATGNNCITFAAGLLSATGAGNPIIHSTNNTKAVGTSDFTSANSAALQAITGLSFPLGSTAQVFTFHCSLMYSQATNVAGDQFGVGVITTAPTNVNSTAGVFTNATAVQGGTLNGLATTTPTSVVTFQPAIATVLGASLDGTIETAGAGAATFNVYVLNGTAADVIVVKRGSYCTVY